MNGTNDMQAVLNTVLSRCLLAPFSALCSSAFWTMLSILRCFSLHLSFAMVILFSSTSKQHQSSSDPRAE